MLDGSPGTICTEYPAASRSEVSSVKLRFGKRAKAFFS